MGKILITGTGRSGTTVLVEILSNLKFDTGFERVYEHQYNWESFAGLESNIDSPHRILKNPNFSFDVEKLIESTEIEHVIIPIRELNNSALSRTKQGNKNGGFMKASNLEEQIITNSKLIFNLCYVLSKNSIPFTFLPFPEFLTNPEILYNNLKFLFDEKQLSLKDITTSVEKIYKPERITIK